MKYVRILKDNLIKNYNTRPFTYELIKRYEDHTLVGIEVGVRMGYNARDILNNVNMDVLFLVDIFFPHGNYRVLKKYDNIKRLEMTSAKASTMFPNGTFDSIYLDASHDFDSVLNDINLWYPKIKPSGLFGGHDFADNMGVPKAVKKFCNDNGLEFKVEKYDWWIVNLDRNVEGVNQE